MRRKLVALLALALAWVAGAALLRRAAGPQRERVDLYFDDGSMVSLEGDAPAAAALFPIARDLLSTVGP